MTAGVAVLLTIEDDQRGLDPADPATVEKWGEWMLGQNFAERTVQQRTKFGRSRLREWGTLDQTPQTLVGWINSHEAAWTRATYFNHLTSLYKFLTLSGSLPADPMKDIRSPRKGADNPKPIPDHQLDHLLACAEGDLRMLLLLGAKAGLRVHEMVKVHGRDLDEHGLTVCGKGGVTAVLPAHRAIREHAAAMGYPTDDYWFRTSWPNQTPHLSTDAARLQIMHAFRAHGISGSSHRLRHSFGTRLANSGTPLHVVQTLMRHGALTTTQKYLGVEQAARQAAIDAL